MASNASEPPAWKWQPPTRPPAPPPPLRTTVPHVFLTRHHKDGFSGPADKLAPVSKRHPPVQPKNSQNNIAAVTPEPARAGLASSATTGHPHADQRDIDNPEDASNSSTACFLGIPTEVHCMIFEYLWTPIVNICIMSSRPSPPYPIHPIFHVNRQIRSEAIDCLRRSKHLTVAFHASTDDVDFYKMASVLEDLDDRGNHFEVNGDGKKTLQVNLHLHFRDAYRKTRSPSGFGEFIACLSKLGFEAEYEYAFTDRDGLERLGDFARLMIVNRILRLIHTPGGEPPGSGHSPFAGVELAVHKMQFPS
jgi:hypothetical protein